MKFKPLLRIATIGAIIVVMLCVDAVIHRRWSEGVIKLKQEEGWTLVAIANDGGDFRHPQNLFRAEKIWFLKSDTPTHLTDNIVTFRVAKLGFADMRDYSLLAFNCADKKAAIVVPGEFRPSKFQWRDYEPTFTAQISKMVCR